MLDLEQEYQEEEASYKAEVSKISAQPGFLDNDQMEMLENELMAIKFQEDSYHQLFRQSSQPSDRVDNNKPIVECVICFEEPSEGIVFVCAQCESTMCEECKDKINACGVCRIRFKNAQPRRSIALERILQKQSNYSKNNVT